VSVSAYGAQQWSGVLVGIVTLPTSFYVALCSDEPGNGWDGTVLQTVEPPAIMSSTSYVRPALGFGLTHWALADAGYAVSTTDVTFATPDVDWGALPWFALCDDPVAGNMWAWGEFAEQITVTAGSTVTVPAGSIALELDNLLPSIAE